MKLHEVHFSSGTVFIHFLDKPYKEINFKSVLLFEIQIVYYFVNKEKILADFTFPVLFHIALIVCAYFCNKIE